MDTDKSKIKTLPIVSLYESETSKQAQRVNFSKSNGNYCPICGSGSHRNKTGALSMNVNKNVFKCFSCGCGGSVIDFIMQLRRLDVDAAADYLNREYFNGTATKDSKRATAPTFKQKTLTPQPTASTGNDDTPTPDAEINAKIYELTADAPDCPDCLAYLDGRGITADIRARWSITNYRAADLASIATELTRLFGVDRLRAAGVLVYNRFFFAQHRILIFNRDADGKFLNIKARALPSDIDDYARRTGKELNKYNGTATKIYPFGLRALCEVPKGSDVLLVEGELDAIAANELADGTAAAVAIGGNGVGRDTYAALLRQIAARGLVVQPNFDADDGGARHLVRFNSIAQELTKEIVLKRRKARNTAKYKDFGDILAATNVTNPDDVAKLEPYFSTPGAYTVRDVATVFNWGKLRTRRALMDSIKYFGFNASFSDDYETIKIL